MSKDFRELRVNRVGIWGKNIPGRGNNQYTDL